jgi:ferredoxin-type protein NapH
VISRHLNKLRWMVLVTVFATLVLIPGLSVYQNFRAAHAYDFLSTSEKVLYNVMEAITDPFTDDPVVDLQAVKGTTWSANILGLKVSDPLAVLGQAAASLRVNWTFAATALIPILLAVVFGRVFCGWICPATLLFELNSNLAVLLEKLGFRTGRRRLDKRLKYVVLLAGILLSAYTGAVWFASIYPPAVLGREIYYAIALGGFSTGAIFLAFCLLFDLLISRRGVCRYLCPGGALYALLGRYRAVRVQRDVSQCNDCGRCDAVCEFALTPMRDGFGQDCTNCSACIAACPTDALGFQLKFSDQTPLGAGHLGREYRGYHDAAAIIASEKPG